MQIPHIDLRINRSNHKPLIAFPQFIFVRQQTKRKRSIKSKHDVQSDHLSLGKLFKEFVQCDTEVRKRNEEHFCERAQTSTHRNFAELGKT